MKRKIIGMLTILLLMPLALAQDEGANENMISPDQEVLWGIDIALEKIELALTFDVNKKAEVRLKHAQERLEEVKEMAEEGNIIAMNKAKDKRNEIIDDLELDEVNLNEDTRLHVTEMLQKHIIRLEEVKAEAPQSAQKGLENAILKSSKVLEKFEVQI